MRLSRKKLWIGILVILILAIAGFFYWSSQELKLYLTPTDRNTQVGSGTVEGTVSFIGAPCNPNQGYNKVPPCDGPYPNYEVILYKEDRTTVAGKVTTDQEGKFRLILDAGTYYFLFNGSLDSKKRELLIVVKENSITRQDITIDNGVR